MKKLLIVRFSSLGDIIQCLETPSSIKKIYPQCEVHWAVREDFSDIVKANPLIDKVWAFNRQLGFLEFVKYCFNLRAQGFSHLYDAHNNLRSNILCFLFNPLYFFTGPIFKNFTRRPKNRFKRFMLFKFRKNYFTWPFKGTHSFHEPLLKWKIPLSLNSSNSLTLNSPKVSADIEIISNSIVLAPSAAWELKRWPVEHWKSLIKLMQPQKFILLGGPSDQFCAEIQQSAPDQVKNYAGKLTWLESTEVIQKSMGLISGDTGSLHIGDFLGKKTLALIGPTAFGYPARPNSKTFEIDLFCKPCSKDGRDKCRNNVYKKCLVDLQPGNIAKACSDFILGRELR